VAFVAAALFATHPLGSQAVTYVVQRLTSLATLFYLLAVALYLAWRLAPRDRGGTRTASYAAFLASAFLAYRTKEIAFTLPAVLVLVEVLLLEPAGWRRFLPIAPAAALALVIPAMLLRGTAPSGAGAAILDDAARSQSTLSRLDYLRTQVVVVADYVRLLAFPSGQNLDPDVPVRHSFLEPAVLAAGAFLAALALAGLLLAARSRRPGPASLDPSARVASLGIGWFFVTVSVESSIVPIADLMYEHRAYLPSVGLFLALSVALNGVAHRLAPRSGGRVAALAGLALALVLASATLARNVVWQDELALWADTAAKSPAKFRPWFNLGTVLSVRGQHGAAATALERALAIDPGHAEARAQLGATLLQAGRLPEAETQLRAALAARPDDPEVLFNLGTLLVRTGSRDEGRALLRRYLEVAPAGQAQGRRAASALLSR
jgi:tetratricopeptide (TPR) repeat protein